MKLIIYFYLSSVCFIDYFFQKISNICVYDMISYLIDSCIDGILYNLWIIEPRIVNKEPFGNMKVTGKKGNRCGARFTTKSTMLGWLFVILLEMHALHIHKVNECIWWIKSKSRHLAPLGSLS